MATEQKLVKVGDDVVAFPGDLEDAHVAKLVKSFRDKKKQPPLSTEESEKARQLKPAQPLSSVLPKTPEWATNPIAEPKDSTPLEKFTTQQVERFRSAHPNVGAVEKGIGGFVEGMRSPANLALAAAAPESKILSAYFAMQALKGSYKDAKSAEESFRKGNNTEAIEYATKAGLGVATAGLAGAHAYKGLPEGVRAKLASEEGSVGPQQERTVKMLTSGKLGGYTLDHWLKNQPGVSIVSVKNESVDPSTLHRLQSWTREGKLLDWEKSNADAKDMPPVEVVRTASGDYLYDGTHRTEFAARQGKPVKAKVFSIKTKDEAPSVAEGKARTYEEVQKDIDNAEDELEKSGTQVTRLYFPEHADVLSKAEGWKAMPDNLVKLYAERDAIGSGQLKQSLGQITSNLKSAGIKDDAEIRHVLEYYALDPNRTDSAKQYMAAEHTQKMVDQSPKRQVEQAYIALASERGIPMDDHDDLWRDRKTTQDAIAAVKAIHSYFYPGRSIDIKGILPTPEKYAATSLESVKTKAQELQDRFRSLGLAQ